MMTVLHFEEMEERITQAIRKVVIIEEEARGNATSSARDGRDASGRPLYWMGVGGTSDEADDYDEHWGEFAYVVALGWASTGKTDAAMKTAADELVAGLASDGEVGRIRSFNWQCRSGVMTPALLK